MGTIRRITDLQLASIGSTKVLSVTSSETLFQISSGMRAFEVGNNGNVALLYYGQSSLAVNSGLFINTSGGAKFWDTITDNFQMAFRTSSGGATVSVIIHEYGGN